MKRLQVFRSSATSDPDSNSEDKSDSTSYTDTSRRTCSEFGPRRKCTKDGTRYPRVSFSIKPNLSGSIKSDTVSSPSSSIDEFLSESDDSPHSGSEYVPSETKSPSEDFSDETTDSLDLNIAFERLTVDSRSKSTSSSGIVQDRAADISSDEESDADSYYISTKGVHRDTGRPKYNLSFDSDSSICESPDSAARYTPSDTISSSEDFSDVTTDSFDLAIALPDSKLGSRSHRRHLQAVSKA